MFNKGLVKLLSEAKSSKLVARDTVTARPQFLLHSGSRRCIVVAFALLRCYTAYVDTVEPLITDTAGEFKFCPL
jgi:hypothetical protein